MVVQRRAARFVTADYRRRYSVTLLLNQLQWQTLPQRRTHSKVTMLYRIHHQLVAIPASPPYNTPALQTVATICSCNTTTPASTSTSTPSTLASSNCGTNIRHSGGCIAQSVPKQTRLLHAALNHYCGKHGNL